MAAASARCEPDAPTAAYVANAADCAAAFDALPARCGAPLSAMLLEAGWPLGASAPPPRAANAKYRC